MNLYPYLPPAFAIYVLAVSAFTGMYARNLITDNVQRNIARDWEIRVGAITSMLSSLVALYSIFETSKSYAWLVGTSLVLVCVFLPLLFWIISNKAGHLESVVTRRFSMRRSTLCAILLVLINLVLIWAIYENQRLTPSHVDCGKTSNVSS